MDAPDRRMPIGMAAEFDRTDEGLAIWRLSVHGVEVPGRWIIVDRECRRIVEDAPEQLRPRPMT